MTNLLDLGHLPHRKHNVTDFAISFAPGELGEFCGWKLVLSLWLGCSVIENKIKNPKVLIFAAKCNSMFRTNEMFLPKKNVLLFPSCSFAAAGVCHFPVQLLSL